MICNDFNKINNWQKGKQTVTQLEVLNYYNLCCT
jgi:hypothetical protein